MKILNNKTITNSYTIKNKLENIFDQEEKI